MAQRRDPKPRSGLAQSKKVSFDSSNTDTPPNSGGKASMLEVLAASVYVAPNAYAKEAPPISLLKLVNPRHQNYWDDRSKPIRIPAGSHPSTNLGLQMQLGTTVLFEGPTPRYLGVGMLGNDSASVLRTSASTARYSYPILLEPQFLIEVFDSEEYEFFGSEPQNTPTIPTSISTEPRMTLTNLLHHVRADAILTPASEMLQPHYHLLAPNHRRVTEAVQALPKATAGQALVLVFCPFEEKFLANPTPLLRPGWRLDAQIGSPATLRSTFPNLRTHGFRSTSVCMAVGVTHPDGSFSYFHQIQSERQTCVSLELVLLTTNEEHLLLARDSAAAYESFLKLRQPNHDDPSPDIYL